MNNPKVAREIQFDVQMQPPAYGPVFVNYTKVNRISEAVFLEFGAIPSDAIIAALQSAERGGSTGPHKVEASTVASLVIDRQVLERLLSQLKTIAEAVGISWDRIQPSAQAKKG